MDKKMKIQELISRYIDNEVTPEEKSIVEMNLTDSKEWQAYYRELKNLDGLLNQHPVAETTPDWELRIHKHITSEHQKEALKMDKKTLFKIGMGGGVLATIIAIIFVGQTYVKRGLQGRLKSAAHEIGNQYPTGLSTRKIRASQVKDSSKRAGEYQLSKHEPYYLQSEDKMARAEMDREVRNYPSKDKFTYEVSGKLEYEESKGEEYPIDTEEIDHITGQFNTEEYARIYENKFLTAADNPLSTFSIDVDTASYSNVRRFLHNNQMPNEDSVRIEELINYFTYNYPGPEGPHPFSITIDGATCPWNKTHNLVRIGLQGKTLNENEIPASNLVFLIDVSGSMSDQNKLPLLKKAFKMMVRQLRSDQRVAIVVYAGAAGQVLDSTPGSNQHKIIRALDRLQSGGSTAGGAGIRLAYKIAQENFIPDGNNRIILATDGDFNIGISSTSEMTRLIEKKREQGIFLTVLGFGMGNYKDNRLEQIADKGNGTYYYIDTEQEAKKVLVHELGSTLFTIAKDVKLQIEFNPTQVKAYRLIGYENRMLAKEDFNDDTKDAGELGAGHTVTAFYEIVPADAKETFKAVDPLKYQQTQVVNSEDLMTVKFRYKDPAGHKSKLISQTINKTEIENHLTNDFQFAASVAEFGLILRQSKFRAQASYQSVLNAAKGSKGQDPFGYRQEFIDLVKKAQRLDTRTDEPLDDTNPEGGFFFKGK